MAVIISWIKTYTSANDGDVLSGQDLGDMQTAIDNHSHTFITGSFLALNDVPATYVGQSLKHVRVNASETGLEFITAGSGGTALSYSQTFVNGDLTSGQITIMHSLGSQAVITQVFDNSFKTIIPDDVIPNGASTLVLDLSSFVPLTGTWTVKVIA